MGRIETEHWIIIGLALSTLNASLGMSISNVALPTLSDFFGVPIQTVQWVVLAYLLALTSVVVSVGRLGDVFGKRKVLLFGLTLFTFSSLICSISTNFGIFIAARGLQGIGGAALVSLPMALVPNIVAKRRMGLVMGLLGTMSAIGTMLGPSLGGVLIARFGWSSIFVPLLLIGSVNYLIVHQFFPRSGQSLKFRISVFDPKGTLFLVVSLICYTLSFTLGETSFSTQNLLLLAGSIIAVLFFINSQKQTKNPLVSFVLFQNKNLSISLFINFLIATVMMSTLIVGPFYLSNALNFQEDSVGLILSVGPLVSVLSGLPAGRLVDRYGSKKLLQLALFTMSIATFTLAVLPLVLGLAGYLCAILLLTPGYQLFLAANNAQVMLESKDSSAGVIAGMLSLSRNIGLISGASVMGAVFAAVAGQDVSIASPQSIMAGMKVTYLIASLLVIICALLVFLNSHNHTSAKSHVRAQ